MQVRVLDDPWTLRQLQEGHVWLLPASRSTSIAASADPSSIEIGMTEGQRQQTGKLQEKQRYLAVMVACFYPIFRRISVGESCAAGSFFFTAPHQISLVPIVTNVCKSDKGW